MAPGALGGLTVRDVRVRALELLPERPVETASGMLRSTPLVLVDLVTEEGIVGKSYLRCYAPNALVPLARLAADIGLLLTGKSGAPAAIEQTLRRHLRLLGPQGLAAIAMAGLDMAAWDAFAQASGLPLVRLLGGEPKPVSAYVSLRSMNPDAAAREADDALAMGFLAVKIKVGRGDLAADLSTIRAIRRVVGDGIHLMADYNQSLSVGEALRRVRALDGEGLYWIEEPTRADDFEGHARIARAADTAIQLGENCWGPHEIVKSIAAHASDHIMLDVMKLGGVSGWLRALALAEAAGLTASSHTFPEFSVHLLGITPTGRWLEYLDHAGPILVEPLRVKDGYALIPGRAGSGLEWNEDAVRQFQAA